MIIGSFTKAFSQLGDPDFRGVLIKSLGLSFALFVVLMGVGVFLLQDLAYFDWEWLNTLAQWAGGGAFLLVLLILFPAISGVFISLFLDQIADAVERKHYAGDPPGGGLPMAQGLQLSLRFTAIMLVINILALPLYMVLIFLTPLNLLLFYAINGYLLSREYFELVSSRHLDVKGVLAARKQSGAKIFPAGVVIAFLFSIPVVNLIAPIVATAAMVHVFKTLQRRRG